MHKEYKEKTRCMGTGSVRFFCHPVYQLSLFCRCIFVARTRYVEKKIRSCEDQREESMKLRIVKQTKLNLIV